MIINVKHLLKVLPIEEKIRDNILSNFDSMTLDQQLDIREYCWRMYFTLLKSQINYEFDKALLEVEEGKRALVTTLYSEIEKKVNKDFSEKIIQIEEHGNLKQVRKELQIMLSTSKIHKSPATKS